MKKYQRSQTYNEIFLESKEENWRQKIDIVQEQPKHFGKLSQIEKIQVDSLINIATNKILAVFGRLEPKDYIDLYVICTQTELQFEELFEMAKEKDTGLSQFYFANTIVNVDQLKTLPTMKTPFDRVVFTKFIMISPEDYFKKSNPDLLNLSLFKK